MEECKECIKKENILKTLIGVKKEHQGVIGIARYGNFQKYFAVKKPENMMEITANDVREIFKDISDLIITSCFNKEGAFIEPHKCADYPGKDIGQGRILCSKCESLIV